LGFQVNYTFSKSLDDVSSPAVGAFPNFSGFLLQTPPQNPLDPGADKGPSTFDITHVLTVSFVQELPFDHLAALRPLGNRLTSGWQLLNTSTVASGSPFTIYSGIQQTGVGTANADRPDLVAKPDFSTARSIREDYFGRGADNVSYFDIPIGVSGGTGPNQGRFGSLGRNTFRGPSYHNFDVALIKDTALGRRSSKEMATLQLRAEFFNAFNLVNFGLPTNVVRGSGFGVISRTAGPSRQVQLSLKLIY
jgi:hypothetical protein